MLPTAVHALNHTRAVGGIGLVIPTLNGGKRWAACLDAIEEQSLKPHRLLNIDSASTDQTTDLAQSAGFEIARIQRSQFNHGGTRQWAVDHLFECAIVIFLTQDAILADQNALSEIVACFDDPKVAVAYGRQIPHKGATPIEAHARLFNYGQQSTKKDITAAEQLGTKVFFCSNSFAAYRRSVLLDLGGFRRDLILGEDMEFAARAIKAGYSNVYCSDAQVYHSHDYTVTQIVERYFDIGVFDRRNSWMREQFGSHGGEGFRFISSEFRYLAKRAPSQIPRALCHTAAKLLGYRLGRLEHLLPTVVKRKLSMLPSYFPRSGVRD
ncbi:MAG TPA: glycosyltransferase family 2 protein [Steroidobacteraceae bacterium]|jgi:rhamnosyltransferase